MTLRRGLKQHWIEQVREFKPQLVAIKDGQRVAELKDLLKGAAVQPEIVVGEAGIIEVASHRDADAVVTGANPEKIAH